MISLNQEHLYSCPKSLVSVGLASTSAPTLIYLIHVMNFLFQPVFDREI